MALDGVLIRALKEELQRKLSGGRIVKIQQPEKEVLLLTFHTENGQEKLLLSANASLPFLYLTADSFRNPEAAPAFCMLLRKHLSGARLLSIDQPGLERMLDFRFEHLSELGDYEEKHLIIELMGKYSNLIFTDRDFMILDAARHVSPSLSSVRTVLPGKPYFLPALQEKKDLLKETREEIMASLTGTDTLLQAISGRYTGISTVTAAELLYENRLDPDRFISTLKPEEKEAFAEMLLVFRSRILSGDFSPAMAVSNEKPLEYSAFSLTGYSDRQDCRLIFFDSPSALLSGFFRERNLANSMKARSADLRKAASVYLEREVKKMDLQEKQLRDAGKREKYRIYGELLNAYAYSLPAGEAAVTVNDYRTGEDVTIALDPDLSIHDNAQLYFEKYGKLKRTDAALSAMVQETKAVVAHLRSILNAIDMAKDPETLSGIREEMAAAGYMKKVTVKGQKNSPKAQPYHYLSSDGFHIYVGKNNLQNDELTFHFARGNDLWFHAKKAPGSHVILRTEGAEVPDRAYEEAGALAAFYSSERNSPKVEVDYVIRKEVKKPAGAVPGFVIYDTNYSLMAIPDISGLREIQSKSS